MAAYLDACDRHAARVTAAPLLAVPDGAGGLIAGYRCPACGHEWTCGWALEPDTTTDAPVAVGDTALLARIRAAITARADR